MAAPSVTCQTVTTTGRLHATQNSQACALGDQPAISHEGGYRIRLWVSVTSELGSEQAGEGGLRFQFPPCPAVTVLGQRAARPGHVAAVGE
jgi:hypothetical protein